MRKNITRNAEEKSTEPQSAQRELNRRNRPGDRSSRYCILNQERRGRRGQRGSDH